MTREVSVIVPTYNEAGNIGEIVRRLQVVLAPYDYEIVVVDDDSPDGTWRLVEELHQKDERVRIIRRTQDKGLSQAVIEGFRQARGELLGVIDADLQHDETVFPSLIERARQVPIAIGSRYVEGGGCGDWSLGRKLKSWIATQIAYLFLSLKVKDPMSGFFVIRKEVFEKVKDRLNPRGFKILLELLYNSDVSAAEVPYCFRSRLAGESKLTTRVAIEYIKQVFHLRKRRPIPLTFLRYCLVGASGVFVDTGVFLLLTRLFQMPVEIPGLISCQTAIFTNFLLNDVWTFSRKKPQSGWPSRIGKYCASCWVGLAIKVLVLSATVRLLGVPPLGGNLLGIVAVTASNFVFSKLWVWR